jgi:hypothetical protein
MEIVKYKPLPNADAFRRSAIIHAVALTGHDGNGVQFSILAPSREDCLAVWKRIHPEFEPDPRGMHEVILIKKQHLLETA